MSNTKLVIRATWKALVERFGCYDAGAELLNTRWGGGHSKGTISKKVHGLAEITVLDVIAFEDAVAEFPITRMMARRMNAVRPQGGDLIASGSVAARETGEAISAILAAAQSARASDRAAALKETDEAIEALRRARGLIEAESGGA